MERKHIHPISKQTVQRFMSWLICVNLLFVQLPTPTRAQSTTGIKKLDDLIEELKKKTEPVKVDKEADKKEGLKTAKLPGKNLPDLKAIKENKEKEPDLPAPKLPTLCRYRDLDCQQKQLNNGQKIGLNQPAAPEQSSASTQIAQTQPPSEGGWFKRMGRKITNAFSGFNTDTASARAGNSFMPAAKTFVAAPPSPPPPSFSTIQEAKLDAHNRIGTSGEDLFSGNYHWSTPLVSLPGRGGLDLNLSLHYNSLQWVRFSNTMYYEPDWKMTQPTGMTAGFNFGFPEIESGYTYDGMPAYLVNLPSGYRIPMRRVYQLSSTSKFEAADGSGLYLVVVGSSAPTLYTPDGTQYLYGATSWLTGSKRCSQVRDSNGNRINITYNSGGLIGSITDTLGRVLNFTYSANQLTQITQTWNGQTHVWAQFDYSPLNLSYNFSGLTIDGPASGSQVSVLTRVITSDGARHVFVYNSWGLVDDVFLYGKADNQRAYLDYVFPNTAQTDGPRFTQRNDGVYDWGGQSYNPSTGFGVVSNYFAFASDESWGQITTPDGIIHKELFSNTGGTRGLSTGMETWVSGVRKKWSTTTWQNDSASFRLYPRVTETNVYDDDNGDGTPENRRRATVSYTVYTKTQAQSTMPYKIYLPTQNNEFAADAATVYRYAQTDYLDDAGYWDRRIMGLPSMQRLYEGSGTLQAQTEMLYDWTLILSHSQGVAQHDSTTYNTNLFYRGNLTGTRRYNVVSGTASGYTETQTDYYLTGNVAKTRDALGREVNIAYDDSFATYADDASNTETVYNTTVKTFAYPTTVTDPAGYASQVKYWYHTGAVTKTTDPKGGIGINIYELTHGRLQKAKNANTGAFTEYAYGTTHLYTQTWTTIIDGSDTNSANRFYSISLTDGAGRLRAVVKDFVKDHANNIFANNSTYNVYDFMGRLVMQSRPTEIDGYWSPAGDDAGGYVWRQQAYDWKGRPTVATNFDGTTTQLQYTGCGCAGGEIVTAIDEVGRTQKSYADTFGRTWKTEIYNGLAVYSTTTNIFNVRDQVTQVTELENATSKSQVTTMTYDGYGRLETRKLPKESVATSYSYYANDQIQTMIDARGASATYTYNTRNLPTNISYSAPSGVAYTHPVSFTYNELGQRLTMTDGLGSVNYNYNTTGQYLNSEVRNLTGVGSYTLSYQYNLGGQLKSITDPFSNTINYTFDKTGQQITVTGSAFANTTQYVNSAKYRTWGAIKEMNFAWGATATLQYNNRMQPTQFSIPNVMTANYFYTASGSANDGRLKRMEGPVGSQIGISYQYDHAGRMTYSWADYTTAPSNITSQPPVQNQTLPNGFQLQPFQQGYDHDAFGNMTNRGGVYWYFFPSSAYDFYSTDFVNGRAKLDGVPGKVHYPGQDRYWTYDNAGNVTNDSVQSITFDAEGRTVYSQTNSNSGYNNTYGLDGDGQLIKTQNMTPTLNDTRYLIRSSILDGQVVTQVNTASGQTQYETNIYINGVQMGKLYKMPAGYPDSVSFEFSDPNNTLRGNRLLDPLGTRVEKGADMQWTVIKDRYWNLQNSYSNLASLMSQTQGTGASPTNMSGGCYMDNVPMPCDIAMRLRGSGEMFGVTDKVGVQYNREKKQFEQYRIEANDQGGWGSFYETSYASYAPQRRNAGTRKTKTRPKVVRPSAERRKATENTPEPTQQPNTQPQPTNSCERFALSLVHQLYNAMNNAGWPNTTAPFRDLGFALQDRARRNVDENGRGRRKNEANETPFDGFKNELVGWLDEKTNTWNFEQRSDVYHHIEMTAGGLLSVNGDANLMGALLKATDYWGVYIQGRKESEIELRDDNAGYAVGAAMLETAHQGRNGDYNGTLYNQIRSILCQ